MKNIITILLLLLATQIGFSQATAITEKKKIEDLISKSGKYFKNAEYEKALDISKLALLRSLKFNDESLIAQSYNAIGVIYDEFSQSSRAIEFYNKALLHVNNTDNDALKDWIYSNLGSVYYYSKIDVKKGIVYYEKSLEFAQKINDSAQITYTKLNIASAYFSINEFEPGMRYVKEVESYIDRKGEEEARLSYYTLNGIYFSNHNNPKLAEAYFFKSIAIGKKNMPTFLVNTYQNLYEHYDLYKNKTQAAFYRNKYDSLNKSLYPEENISKLNDAALQIELDENKHQLEKIETANELNQKKINDSKIISILFSIILIVLLLLVYTLYRNNNSKKKLNSELTLANNELRIAKEKAEEISQLKTQFVATISHELRTPLYGVIGITNMFLDEHKEHLNNEHLHSLKFSARYLLALVNDILQINKMEEKKIVLENTTFNLQSELNTIVNSLTFIADKNDNSLRIEIDPAIPEFLIGDELRLSQILMNLISNALKFTHNGEVIVTANLDNVIDKTHYIMFTVKDNGIGIAKHDQEKIFDKFVQIERKDGDYQGTGLGLTIVQRLIELFNSKLYLESGEGAGTTFSFTIGFTPDDTLEKGMVAKIVTVDFDKRIFNILVVEDNKINQMVTKRIIERYHHICVLADNGYDALELLQHEKFDIILMDINMPMINGYETSRRIRDFGITTPIIALTAFDKNEVEPQAILSGIDGVIIKPFDPSELFELIAAQVK
ncbi:MAG: response regulator [Flavobacterium sp.]|nr:response regulator [Flavobacterium sp.]